MTLAYSRASLGSWNATKWDNEAFNTVLLDARGDQDQTSRKELYWECQRLVHSDGGLIAPVWADKLDAKSSKVSTGEEVAGDWDLDATAPRNADGSTRNPLEGAGSPPIRRNILRGYMTQQTRPLDAVFSALVPIFGDRLSTAQVVCDQHTAEESWLSPAAPDAVVMAQSTEKVAEILRLCHTHGVPVVPFGAGSSIEGQVNAPEGDINLDLSSMDRALAVHPEDMDCTVQCGVTR
ncbi:FAD-binding protein [Leisingera daeponensis]|nr:FAD-binding protein [Leisingera daeponensis]